MAKAGKKTVKKEVKPVLDLGDALSKQRDLQLNEIENNPKWTEAEKLAKCKVVVEQYEISRAAELLRGAQEKKAAKVKAQIDGILEANGFYLRTQHVIEIVPRGQG